MGNDMFNEEQLANAAELEKARAEQRRDEAMRALESLTPGGSGFVGDVGACKGYLRGRLDRMHEMVVRLVREKREALASEARAKGEAERMAAALMEARWLIAQGRGWEKDSRQDKWEKRRTAWLSRWVPAAPAPKEEKP